MLAVGEVDTLGNENTPGKRNATEAISTYRQIVMPNHQEMAEAMLGEV